MVSLQDEEESDGLDSSDDSADGRKRCKKKRNVSQSDHKRVCISEVGDHADIPIELSLTPESGDGYLVLPQPMYRASPHQYVPPWKRKDGEGCCDDMKYILEEKAHRKGYIIEAGLREWPPPHQYAFKGYRKCDLTPAIVELSNTQYELLKLRFKLNHRNVLRLYTWELIGPSMFITFSEYCPGSLEDYRQQFSPPIVPEQWVHAFAADIFSGLEYLHSRKIVHGNLQLSCMLLSSSRILKLTGLVNTVTSRSVSVGSMSAYHPEFQYEPPELLSQSSFDIDPAMADIYRFGVAVYTLLMGQSPFQRVKGGGGQSLLHLKYACFPMMPANPPAVLTGDVRCLIKGMMHPNPKHRLSLNQVKYSAWMSKDPKPGTILQPFKWLVPVRCTNSEDTLTSEAIHSETIFATAAED